MKRIIYQVVVAKTSEDNELWRYKTEKQSVEIEDSKDYAEKLRKQHPEYAFIVLERRHEIYDEEYKAWDLEREEFLEHY